MNAWYSLLDRDADGTEGSLLVTEWNDEVMFLIRDNRDNSVRQHCRLSEWTGFSR